MNKICSVDPQNVMFDLEQVVKFFKLFMERSQSVFWVRDHRLNKQIFVSPAYEKIWKQSCEYLYQNPAGWIDTVVPEDRNRRAAETRLELLEEQGPHVQYVEKFRIKRPDGTIAWIKDAHFPIYDEAGNHIGFAGISDDITDDINREQELTTAKQRAEVANRAKSEFLAMMSHDLRTPLNAIIGMAQILKNNGHLSTEQGEYVDIIHRSGHSLLTLVNDILDFVLLESWALKIVNKPFDLRELVSHTRKSFAIQAKEKNLTLNVLFANDIPPVVIGDESRIQQVIFNLVNNAIKFTNQGSVKLLVQCVKRTRAKAHFRFTVRDTGVGIHEDNLALIFDKFSQVDPVDQRKHHGVGLGLAIVKGLVERMAGEIQVKSQLGVGSEFIVDLPLKIQKGSALVIKDVAQSEIPITPTMSQPHRILLVEDNEINQKIAKIMIENLGSHLDVVDCGSAALQQLKAHRYDLIFMDIGLPDMSGFEVVKLIRQNPAWKSIPIFAMTAHILERDRKKALKAGMNGLIVKPISQEQIAEVVMKESR